MLHWTTTFIFKLCGKPQSWLPTTLVRAFIRTIVEVGLAWVVFTLVEIGTNKFLLTNLTVERNKSCIYLPVDIFPCDSFLLVHIRSEIVYVKSSISNVLSYNLAVKIDENISFGTTQPRLAQREKFVAKSALRQSGTDLRLVLLVLLCVGFE